MKLMCRLFGHSGMQFPSGAIQHQGYIICRRCGVTLQEAPRSYAESLKHQ